MPLTPRLLCDDMIALKRAAIAGLGVVALPGYVCREDVRLGALRQVLPACWRTVDMTPTGSEHIPPRSNRNEPICFSPFLYRARNLVERFFNKIKQCRRVATRYDKLAANYLAFVQLASIRLWLRVNESTP
jgi:DNA-binding transcriptional LysR family regulator